MKPGITRRSALLGLGAAFSLGRASMALAAASTDSRLVVIIMRGALDGMAAVVPYGDPGLAALRPGLIPAAVGADGGMADLGGFYGLHPAMPVAAAMFKAGELLPVHAVAGHYRSRSHFEAQDYMESGADHRMTSGWLNRAVLAMAKSPGPEAALAVGLTTPLLMRGTRRGRVVGAAEFRGTRCRPVCPHRRAERRRSDHRAGHRGRDAGPRLLHRNPGRRGQAGQRLRISRPGGDGGAPARFAHRAACGSARAWRLGYACRPDATPRRSARSVGSGSGGAEGRAGRHLVPAPPCW